MRTTEGVIHGTVARIATVLIMSDSKPPKFHYLEEWAAVHGMDQSDVARGIDVDKGTVSRWFGGKVPSEGNLLALARLFNFKEPAELFRHPDTDWLARLFKHKNANEIEVAKKALELMFKNTGTDG